MPIVHFHLVEGTATREREAELLRRASALYAEVLESPIERVRAFIHTFPPTRAAVGGVLVADGGSAAPFFEFLVLEGRPLEQRQALLTGFTDLIAEILDVEKSLIRGRCKRVMGEEWSIGGRIAAELRADHIQSFTAKGVR